MSELSVPWLRSGTGSTPAEGGCILQVIDWIDRNQWTDRPVCVHPAIAKVAIRANDTLPDGERQKLLDLAPRIMGTGGDKKLSVQLAVFCARQVLHLWEDKHPTDMRPRKSIEAAEAWIENPTEENRQKALEARKAAAYAACAAAACAVDVAAYAAAAVYAAAAACAKGQAVYSLLVSLLDEYDRLTGRGAVEAVDLTPACVAMAGSKVRSLA